MELSTPIEKVFMVGPTYGKRLKKLGIETVEDLLYHFPFRYENYALVSKIGLVQPGETVTIKGRVEEIKNEYTKHGKKIQKAKVSDETGIIEVVWYNQPFLVKVIPPGSHISLSGKVELFRHSLILNSPSYELLKEEKDTSAPIHTGRLVPIYSETYGVSSKWLRSRIAPLLKQCTPKIFEYLPDSIIKGSRLLTLPLAIEQIHFPISQKMAGEARIRLSFDELFLIQLASLKRKEEWTREVVGNKFQISKFKQEIQQFFEKLPFLLTTAQRKAVGEILTDLAKVKPMNRLLEGDVGSGKTVVATAAMYVSYLNGYQSALMAPTEILAFQHFKTITFLLKPLGVKISLKTGSKKIDTKPYTHIIVGTHALLSRKLEFQKLGLVVIDEQHRFGVEQRALLRQKGINPHLLTMTATPIPRTVALTLYGELDLSFLDEMPPGRQRVKTWVVPTEKRGAAYEWIRKQVKKTPQQAFIICPLIEESETLSTVRAATAEYRLLQKEIFPDLALGLLHGRMKTKEKDKVLQDFRDEKLDILVATPVVEVGIDIPTATIMMIEAAERFGLAQLHQLRGRVGRSEKQSYCLLFTESDTKVLKRLKALETMHVGAELAELDLKLRGPGEIYGTRQHGIPNLKVASLTDLSLISKTRREAGQILKEDGSLNKYPLLQEKLKKFTIKKIAPD